MPKSDEEITIMKEIHIHTLCRANKHPNEIKFTPISKQMRLMQILIEKKIRIFGGKQSRNVIMKFWNVVQAQNDEYIAFI